ncbi:hypothetical protein D3C79_867610 [compost metagenome]
MAQGGVELLVDLPAVGDRCFATLCTGLDTVEPDLHRPLQGIRLLVVQRDDLVRGVFGGGVHPLLDCLARGGAEFVVEQRVAKAAYQCLERLFTQHIETPQQEGATFM